MRGGHEAVDQVPDRHLGTFAQGGCEEHARTMVLGATNSWFASQLWLFSIPRAEEPLTQAVKEHGSLLSPLAAVPADAAKMLLPTQACWPELEQYGADAVWAAVTKEAQAVSGDQGEEEEEFDLTTPEWRAFTHPRDHALPDFTTVREQQLPEGTADWLDSVVLVHRLREVSALTGFTRIEAPEWLPEEEARTLSGAPLSRNAPTWVPCAELRGEGVFLALKEERLAEGERQEAVRAREEMLGPVAGREPSGRESRPAVTPTDVPAARSGTPSRRLPGLLAALCDRLPEDRVAVLASVFETLVGPDDPLLSRFIAAQPAAGLAHQLTEITRAWRAEAPDMPGSGFALSLATVRSLPRPRPTQVVVSGPMSASLSARLTSGVAVEVIRSADTSLLIASFAAHGARDVVREIGRAVSRGVRVDLLLEESTQASAAFASLPDEVHVWHRVAASGVLHAKLVAADRHTALLGSANLTDRALSDNVELGVVLRDPHTVEPLVDHFRWMLAPENNVMRLA